MAHGVKGVTCLDAGSREAVQRNLTTDQQMALAKMDSILSISPGMTMGTIEVYANGALNVYVHDEKGVIGYVTYRP